MKVINEKRKCAVCGAENDYSVILSYMRSGYPDLDMKPYDPDIGFNIQECPNCHYCNYDIRNSIVEAFDNNLENWKGNAKIQEYLANPNAKLRQVLVLAHQYSMAYKYRDAYKHLIMASWLCEDKEKASFYQGMAMKDFCKEILPKHIDDILQAADIFRMNNIKEYASLFLDMIGALYKDESKLDDEDKFKKKIIEAERELIAKGDTARHNISEFINK